MLAKAVPDVKNVRLTIKDNDIDTAELNFVINEQDSYALEEGLRLKEKLGGEVIVVSVGDEARKKGITQVIRECYAKGADRGIMLLDQDYAKWDGPVRARVMAALLAPEKPDVVLMGSQSFDTATSRMGPMLGEAMGVAHVSLITALEAGGDGRTFAVSRDLEGGLQEKVKVAAPCIFTTQTGINTPRYAALSKIIMATRKEIKTLTLEDAGMERAELEKLNRVRVTAAGFPEEKEGNALILTGTPEEVAAQLVKSLREKGLLQR